jgi:hypothetical protein
MPVTGEFVEVNCWFWLIPWGKKKDRAIIRVMNSLVNARKLTSNGTSAAASFDGVGC